MTAGVVAGVGARPGRTDGLRAVVALLAAALVGGVLGLSLVVVALRTHPVAVMAIPLLVAVVVAGLRRPVWALVPLLVSLPLGSLEVAGVGIVQVGASLSVALGLGLRLLRGERVLLSLPHGSWLVAMWGVLLVAAATGAATGPGITAVVLLGTSIALAAVVATITSTPGDLRLALGLLLVVALAMCAVAALDAGAAQVSYGGALVEGRSQGTFSQPNELGTFAGMTTMLAVGCLVAGVRGLRVLAGLAALAGTAAAAASLSRGAWIGMALALAGVLVLRPDSRRVLVGSMLGLLVSVAVASSLAPGLPQVEVVQSRVESLADPTANPYDERPAIYREAVRQIREAPWLGHGPEAFPEVAVRRLENGARAAPSHAHNTLLVAASEGGLVTAGLLVAFTLAVVRSTRRQVVTQLDVAARDRVVQGAVLGAAAGLAVLVGQGLVDFSFRNPTLQLFVFAVLGVLLGGLRRRA